MSKRMKKNDPETRCVTCGKRIKGNDYAQLWRRYSQHQIDERGKPGTGAEARSESE